MISTFFYSAQVRVLTHWNENELLELDITTYQYA